MNPEQQIIAIAEACRWKEFEAWLDGRRCFERADSNAELDFDSLPDFLTDLNAMHEAEKVLTPEQLVDYCAFSLRVATGEGCVTDYKMICATAAQRAEAFLRTIGKWEEANP